MIMILTCGGGGGDEYQGPNGTGKSSIVCALCVGLGGKTSLLDRAESISSFIRHGKQHAYTEVREVHLVHN